MDNYPKLDSEILAHHGILGMKWGKRNGPPYPLSAGKHSSSEKKAGWKKSLGGGRNEELYDRKSKDEKTSKKSARQEENTKVDKTNSPVQNGTKGLRLTSNQKKAIAIGAGIAAAILVTYGLYTTGNLDKLADRGKNITDRLLGEVDPKTGFRKLTKPLTIKQRLRKANPGYTRASLLGDLGRRHNCPNAVIANECLSRGLNVKALWNPAGMRREDIGQFFKGFHSDSFLQLDNPLGEAANTVKSAGGRIINGEHVMKTISEKAAQQFPEGARGVISVKWFDGGGHQFSWRIENGAAVFEDPQSHKYDTEFMLKMFSNIGNVRNGDAILMTRLDDLEINADNIRNAVASSSNPFSFMKFFNGGYIDKYKGTGFTMTRT